MVKRSCDEAIAQVYVYLDGELTWMRRTRVRRHLRKCQHCLGAFDFETRLKTIVREKTQGDPQPEIVERLRAFLEENEPGFGE